MTVYTIEIGYTQEGGWERLKEIANSITQEELIAEYLECETLTRDEEGTPLAEFVEKYWLREDSTITIDESGERIEQYVSGSGDSREMKMGLRRAFCRLVLQRAHKEHIEVNIIVS